MQRSYATWTIPSCGKQTSTIPNVNIIRKHSSNTTVWLNISAAFRLPYGFPAYHRCSDVVHYHFSLQSHFVSPKSWSNNHRVVVPTIQIVSEVLLLTVKHSHRLMFPWKRFNVSCSLTKNISHNKQLVRAKVNKWDRTIISGEKFRFSISKWRHPWWSQDW